MSVASWVAVGDSQNNRVRVGVWYGFPRFFIQGSGFGDITVDGPNPAMIGSLAYLWNLLFFSAAHQQPCHTVLANKIAFRLRGGWDRETEAL